MKRRYRSIILLLSLVVSGVFLGGCAGTNTFGQAQAMTTVGLRLAEASPEDAAFVANAAFSAEEIATEATPGGTDLYGLLVMAGRVIDDPDLQLFLDFAPLIFPAEQLPDDPDGPAPVPADDAQWAQWRTDFIQTMRGIQSGAKRYVELYFGNGG